MAYTKTLIGTITPQGFNDQALEEVQAKVAAIVDENLTALETAMGALTSTPLSTATPAAVTTKTSGAPGSATTASKSDHKHGIDLGAATLADLGLTIPTYSGKLSTIAGTSTLLELLAAIDAITA